MKNYNGKKLTFRANTGMSTRLTIGGRISLFGADIYEIEGNDDAVLLVPTCGRNGAEVAGHVKMLEKHVYEEIAEDFDPYNAIDFHNKIVEVLTDKS